MFEVGTPVVNIYGTQGVIGQAKAPECKSFIIGATMERVRTEYEVIYPDSVSSLSDHIVAPFVAKAEQMGLPKLSAAEVEEARAAATAATIENRSKYQAERKKADEDRAAFKADAAKRIPAGAKAVIVAEYEVDDCDSMSDYYNSKTTRVVILGFSNHTRDLFPELRKFAAMFPETAELATAPESAEHREKYSMGAGYYLKATSRYRTGWAIRKRTLYHGAESIPSGEWLETKAAPVVAVVGLAPTGTRIEEHTHTKRGFQMFIVILAERVERDEFERLRDSAQALGGWYSRPWGKTPGGFAFKDKATAEAFAGAGTPEAASADVAPASNNGATAPSNSGLADKLRDLADGMDSDIANKLGDRLSNTPKRMKQAAEARIEGARLQRTQAALRALAALHDAGTCPPVLSQLRSKSAAYALLGSVIDRSNAGYYDAGIDTGKPAKQTPDAVALWALLAPPSAEETKKEELRRKVAALQFASIPGYFPTPAAIVARMIEEAGLPSGGAVKVLEPEAGSGAILDVVREHNPDAVLTAYERQHSLREILELKGYTLDGSDFLEEGEFPSFDYVLMNPPFENGQDIDHVRHAYNMLERGGVLVAIMGPGAFFRRDKKAEEFRAWFDRIEGRKVALPSGSFKESGTGVETVMVTLCA